MTTALFFNLSNRNLKEIQLIIIFTKIINLAKQAIDITKDLVIMTGKKRAKWLF